MKYHYLIHSDKIACGVKKSSWIISTRMMVGVTCKKCKNYIIKNNLNQVITDIHFNY